MGSETREGNMIILICRRVRQNCVCLVKLRLGGNAPPRAKLTNWRDSSADGNGLSVPHSTEVNSQEHLRHGGELMGRFYDLVRYEMMDDLTFTYHFTTRLIVHHPSVGPNFFIIFVRKI